MATFTHQGIDLNYEVTGEGPTVLLLHSFLASSEMWTAQVEALKEQYQVVTLDLRGHGRSAAAASPFTICDLAEDGFALLEHLGIESAAWFGLSIGGMIAQRAALKRPERIWALGLLNTHAGSERLGKRLRYGAMSLGVRLLGVKPFLGAVMRLMFGDTALKEQPDLMATWRSRIAGVHVPSTLRYIRALVRRASLVDEIRGVRIPTLVVGGEEDRALPARCAEQIHRRISGSCLHILEKTGHLSVLEQPERMNALILDFLVSPASSPPTTNVPAVKVEPS